jgi:hypothetical protein
MQLFNVVAKIYFLNVRKKICPQKVEKTTPKSCILMAVVCFFFSAALTAQNSPKLHFHSFIQPSLVGSLVYSYGVSSIL